MKRVVIIGSTGSGKTTLAKKLSAQFGLAFTDLDDLNHLPGWKTRLAEEFRRLTDIATSQEKWVVAGNYSRLHDLTWGRADTVIWLDYSFWTIARQLALRSFRRAATGEPVCNGNTETWRKLLFSKESIFLWFLKSFPEKKKKYTPVFSNPAAYPALSLVWLKSPQQTEQWLRSLS